MRIPFHAADARPPSPARSQIQNNVGEGSTAASCVLGLKLRTLRVGAALLSPPSSRSPLKDALGAERRVARNTMCSNQSRRLAEIGRDSADISSISIIDGTLTKLVEMLWGIIAPELTKLKRSPEI